MKRTRQFPPLYHAGETMGETENNARILLVDDVMENIKVAGSVLKENGYQLNIAKNGKIALKV